jgi:hypothetical protein
MFLILKGIMSTAELPILFGLSTLTPDVGETGCGTDHIDVGH